MTDISNRENSIDIRDIIDRIEELKNELDTTGVPLHGDKGDDYARKYWNENPDGDDYEVEREELSRLTNLLNDLRGTGGDHEWRGDWYPSLLIRDSYFIEYAEQFAADIGAIDANAVWPIYHIDWKAAAESLRQDFQRVDYDGVTYWYR
jgi:hypothetical protein